MVGTLYFLELQWQLLTFLVQLVYLIAKEGRLDHVALRERVMATSTPIQSYRRKTIGGGRLKCLQPC